MFIMRHVITRKTRLALRLCKIPKSNPSKLPIPLSSSEGDTNAANAITYQSDWDIKGLLQPPLKLRREETKTNMFKTMSS